MLESRLTAVGRLLVESMDVLTARPVGGVVPSVLETRCWSSSLLALPDDRLDLIEASGFDATWPEETPPTLRALIDDARAACSIPAFPTSDSVRAARRLETPRKREQVDAFTRVIVPLAAHASRVIDVGSGHGHLTRELAERIPLQVVGLERDETLAVRARSLPTSRDSLSFARTDVLLDGLALSSDDCVIGLHACGELGDAMVEQVARARASLALVGCCLQKRRASSRVPLCDAGLELPTRLLGLSNLTARDDGVEATRVENLAARERRLALHHLLEARIGKLRLGAEIEGLNRRVAHGDLSTLVARAFAIRALPVPTTSAIAEAARWAAIHQARARRLSLPRITLARVLEVYVLLDRACRLEQRGFEVSVATLFPASVSARNLVLVARPTR